MCDAVPPFVLESTAGVLAAASGRRTLLDWVRGDHRDAVTERLIAAAAGGEIAFVSFPGTSEAAPQLCCRVRRSADDNGGRVLRGYLEVEPLPPSVRERQTLLAAAVEHVAEAVFVVNAWGWFLHGNGHALSLLAADANGGQRLLDVLCPLSDERYTDTRNAIREGLEWPAVTRGSGVFRSVSGDASAMDFSLAPVDLDPGLAPRFVLTLSPVTEHVEAQSSVGRGMASSPPVAVGRSDELLTGLEAALEPAHQEMRALSVIVVEQPVLRDVGAAYGPELAAGLLERSVVAARRAVPDTLLAGALDEASFAMVVRHALEERAASQGELGALRAVLREPMALSEGELRLDVYPEPAFGVALFPGHGGESRVLLLRARAAAREAAAGGYPAWRYFRELDPDVIRERLATHGLMRRGLAETAFSCRYLGRFRLGTSRLVGVRQVLFWDHALEGASPAESRLGDDEMELLGEELDEWRLVTACRDWHRWQAVGFKVERVCVPLAGRTLASANFARTLRALLRRERLPFQALEVELPAAALLTLTDGLRQNLMALARYGVGCVLSGLEEGGVDLSALRELPLTALRVGEDLATRCITESNSASLLRAIALFGRGLGIPLVVGGMRDDGALRFLTRQAVEEFEAGTIASAHGADALPACFPGGLGPSWISPPKAGEEALPVVLVVDDDPQVLRALQRELRRGPWQLVTRESGEDALRFIGDTTVAVVLSDERMPGMSGLELLAGVRQTAPATCRLIMSAHSDPERLAEAAENGLVFRVVAKPWERDELRRWLEEAVIAFQDASRSPRPAG